MTTDWTSTAPGLEPNVLNRRGSPLHYWVGGPQGGSAIAFLHGATMDHRMFNAQIPAVLGDHRVLAWDARGHGRSRPIGTDDLTIEDYVDDLVAVLDDAGIDQVLLVGQSMGAYIAQHTILRHPERVAGLVVIGSTPIALPLSWADHLAVRLVAPTFRIWPLAHLRRTIAKTTAVRAVVQAYAVDAVSMISHRDLDRIFTAVATAVRREGFPLRIDVPFLLTHGEHDGTGNIRKDAPGWAASDERIDYVVIPDAGHNANQDNSSTFNDELLRYLGGAADPLRPSP